MGGVTGKGGSDTSVGDTAAAQEAQRQQDVQRGTKRVDKIFNNQFTPDYYAKIAQGYQDYANPQLDDQYQKTQRNLTYALTRDGNLDSSTSADQQTDLHKQYDANKLQVANQGQTYAQNAQSNVETARAGLINSLESTGNAAGTANLASNQAAALAAPPTYSALGDLFSGTTSALAAQAAAERAQALGGSYKAPYSTGLFA